MLATVLFVDVVGSTERASRARRPALAYVLDRFEDVVRQRVTLVRQHLVDAAGDGALATFDGPARAIRCARYVRDEARRSGSRSAAASTRRGHAAHGGLAGIAVHIGARVAALADPGEVLVTRTVRDLVAGSGIVFEDRGEHELKGVPDRWALYAAVG